jgi:ubiquinone/menaquinone biosynthesis C-methylase UbiE
MDKETKKVAEFWAKHEPVIDAGGFYSWPLIRPYIIENAWGKEVASQYRNDKDFAENILISNYLQQKSVESILSLCCGFGSVERFFVSQYPNLKKLHGIDVSLGALEVAKQKAESEGLNSITYECSDLNYYHWEKESYDLIIANGALHHIRNLEDAIKGIYSALKPGGILYCCEYVGPSYQDHSPRQMQIINAVANLVPGDLRSRKGIPFKKFNLYARIFSKLQTIAEINSKNLTAWKKLIVYLLRKLLIDLNSGFDFGVVHFSPKDQLLKTDPSECIRSDEIIPILKKYFQKIDIKPMGGGILMHALDYRFYENFDKDNPSHLKCLDMLFHLERHFMQSGEISIENAFIYAIKPN